MMASIRAKARLNLLVAACNTALERGLFTLDCEEFVPVTFDFTLDGYPAVAQCRDVFKVVALQVILCPTALGREHIATAITRQQARFGAAIASGLLERGNWKYLEDFRYR